MSDTQAIKDRLDIVQLIGEYAPLKKAGATWKARCPFHNEKTPSFVVARDKQMWHCFGCGKGGDIFSFIQEIEGLDFLGALKLLADRAGVKIDNFKSEINTNERNRVLQALAAAADFYHNFLLQVPAAAVARDYLTKRQLSPATINDWTIGYSPDQWELLTKYLVKKGFGINDLVAAGLTIAREGASVATGRGYYDRFRARIMFPITDAHNAVVGFTGRIIKETPNSGGKYVNSPQTICYDKSKILFGLAKAKTAIKAQNAAVVVEGQMDVIASHQAGIKNVVAASGTALTIEQVRLLKRYSENIIFGFDADAAGDKAGARGIDVALQEGMAVKVIQLPPAAGKDADEVIKKDPALWQTAINTARGAMDWYFERAFADKNINDPKVARDIAAALLSRIILIPYAIEREPWLKKLADRLRIDLAVVRAELKNTKPMIKEFIPKNMLGSTPLQTNAPAIPESLATELWSLVIKWPVLWESLFKDARGDYFADTPYAMLYEKAKELYTNSGMLDINALRQSYDGGEQNFVDLLLIRPYKNRDDLTAAEASAEAASILERIKNQYKKKRGQDIALDIAAAEANGDKDLVSALIQELQLL